MIVSEVIKIGDLDVKCDVFSHSHGFDHSASVVINGKEYEATAYYRNRTWEEYRFQKVLRNLFREIGGEYEKKFKEWEKERNTHFF